MRDMPTEILHYDLCRLQNPTSPSLLKTLVQSFSPTLFAVIPPAIVRSLSQVVQPILVNSTLTFMDSYSGPSPESGQWGWSLVGAFAIIFAALAASTSQYFYYIYRSGALIRGAMVEAIYMKTLNLAADRVGGADEGEEAVGNALNLMRYPSFCLNASISVTYAGII